MKKILSFLCAISLCVAAQAQIHSVQSLLNVRALATGTNTLGFTGVGGGAITNLAIIRTNPGMVLHTNITFTNLAGTVVRVAGGVTNSVSTTKLFTPVSLNFDREGRPIYNQNWAYNSTNIGIYTNYSFSPMTLLVDIANPLGTNGNIGINFCPLWDGTNATISTADDWSIVISQGIAPLIQLSTNVPTWKWPGARAFTVRNITNDFGPATPAATLVTNSPYIINLSTTTFRP